MKRVLTVQNYWDDPPGYLYEIMQEYGIACETIKANEASIPDPGSYDALIVLGGPQHANAEDKYPYLAQEKELLRQVVEQDIPYLGLCLGGQLLASAMGAAVTRHSMCEIGFYEVQLTAEGKADPLFQNLPGSQQVIQWHEDTFGIPRGGVRLATGENTPNQAFRIGRRAYGLQYHIEVSSDMLNLWFRNADFKKGIIKVIGAEAMELIERAIPAHYPIYREHTRTVFENFLKISGCL